MIADQERGRDIEDIWFTVFLTAVVIIVATIGFLVSLHVTSDHVVPAVIVEHPSVVKDSDPRDERYDYGRGGG